jgi:HD-GYP domain-containing protein (c-di-GMP phosphodiesterase class II)
VTPSAASLASLRAELADFTRDLALVAGLAPAAGPSLGQVVAALAAVVEAKDGYTRGHLDRAHAYAVALAQIVDPAIADDHVLGYGFLLHDIGKVGIPGAVLSKPGPLTPDEWAVMRTHPLLGAELVAPLTALAGATPVIRSHHERWDGTGYPDGLAGTTIPMAARIFAVADCYDALTTSRPYRGALPVEEAVTRIRSAAGGQFDPSVVAAFDHWLVSEAPPSGVLQAGDGVAGPDRGSAA